MENKRPFKWRTVIALIIMYLAIFTYQDWMWGVLFLYWVIPNIFSGITYFIEPIERKTNPVLFWIIIISWIWMALYFISTLFVDYDNYYY